jgi:hypothetical protein
LTRDLGGAYCGDLLNDLGGVYCGDLLNDLSGVYCGDLLKGYIIYLMLNNIRCHVSYGSDAVVGDLDVTTFSPIASTILKCYKNEIF